MTRSGLNWSSLASAIRPLAAVPDHFELGVATKLVRDQAAEDD